MRFKTQKLRDLRTCLRGAVEAFNHNRPGLLVVVVLVTHVQDGRNHVVFDFVHVHQQRAFVLVNAQAVRNRRFQRHSSPFFEQGLHAVQNFAVELVLVNELGAECTCDDVDLSRWRVLETRIVDVFTQRR